MSPASTAEMAVQANLSLATAEAAVQATPNTAHGIQSTAAQAGPQAEQAQHSLHHVADALCPDGWYHSPAVQAVPPRHVPVWPTQCVGTAPSNSPTTHSTARWCC